MCVWILFVRCTQNVYVLSTMALPLHAIFAHTADHTISNSNILLPAAVIVGRYCRRQCHSTHFVRHTNIVAEHSHTNLSNHNVHQIYILSINTTFWMHTRFTKKKKQIKTLPLKRVFWVEIKRLLLFNSHWRMIKVNSITNEHNAYHVQERKSKREREILFSTSSIVTHLDYHSYLSNVMIWK